MSRLKRHLTNQTLSSAQRRSFTLVELLVVIAVISIIAALLMPSLNSAKQSAQDVQCGQNERQIQMAIRLYADDHDYKYPSPIVWDQQYRQIYLLSNYVRPLTFFRCPLSRGDINDPAWAGVYYTPAPVDGVIQRTEYKINDDGGLVGNDLGGLLRPQKIVFVIDAMDGSPRHRGKSNLCFFDGHVELLPISVYTGKEPGGSPTGPDGWWQWGLRD